MPTDQEMLTALYPNVGKAVAKGQDPQNLAQIYEGGGLQQPMIDPVEMLAGAAGMRIAKGGAAAAEKLGTRAAEFLDPEDPLGSTNYLLKNFSYKKMPLVTREGHAALERAAATSSKAAEKLASFEKNMHRQNNLSMAYSVFDDVDTLVPKQAKYFRSQLKDLTVRLHEGLAKSAAESGGQTKVPTDVVKDMQSLLGEYRDALVEAGHR